MPIKTVTFDFWGTLYRNKVSLKHQRKDYIQKTLAESGISGITDTLVYQAMEQAWVIWDDVWRREHRTLPVEEFITLVFKHLAVAPPPEHTAQLCESIQEAVFTGNTLPVDHVAATVERLAGTRTLGVISDTGVSSGRYLSQLIERDHPGKFTFGLYSDELGMSKPRREIFDRVLAITGCTAGEVVHVGDLRYTDVLGARQAGMHSVRYAGIRDDQTPGYPEADFVITDYRDLPDIIEGIQ
jgi:putative hydrolase of the HAD superfamily